MTSSIIDAVVAARRDAAAWAAERFEEFNRAIASDDETVLLAFLRTQYTEDAAIDFSETTVDSGAVKGPHGVKGFLDNARGALGSVRFEPIEVIELDDHTLALWVRVSGRGGTTGLEMTTEVAYLNRFADDRRIRASTTYRTLEEALAAYARS